MSEKQPSFSQIVDMASKMQSRIDQLHTKEDQIKATGQSNNRTVTATANGQLRIESINIESDQPVDMLCSSIVEACNHALKSVELTLKQELLALSNVREDLNE
ncbi:MAG: hypothetical protein CMF46_01225 [Legionellales bacterium]|nr:hypothetical protein [Legionellales bacterium]|tara:strand:+ start:39 stop:347 length:309 start_codon:yes stop_codon:yes gene_type:complete